jgi:hypothetical protein
VIIVREVSRSENPHYRKKNSEVKKVLVKRRIGVHAVIVRRVSETQGCESRDQPVDYQFIPEVEDLDPQVPLHLTYFQK